MYLTERTIKWINLTMKLTHIVNTDLEYISKLESLLMHDWVTITACDMIDSNMLGLSCFQGDVEGIRSPSLKYALKRSKNWN